MLRTTLRGRNRAVSVVVMVVATGGCFKARTDSMRDPDKQKCPNFGITPNNAITITDKADKIHLGGNTYLIVPKDALPQNTERKYVANPINVSGEVGAGFSIVPTDGLGATEFEEPVEVRLGYAGCPFEAETKPFVIVRTDGNDTVLLGGAKVKKKKYVSALTDGFSDFAIAID